MLKRNSLIISAWSGGDDFDDDDSLTVCVDDSLNSGCSTVSSNAMGLKDVTYLALHPSTLAIIVSKQEKVMSLVWLGEK